MKAKCISNLGATLGAQALPRRTGYSSENVFDRIDVGREYTIYAIQFAHGILWYYIVQKDDFYPWAYPAKLFDLSESEIPIQWKLAEIEIAPVDEHSAPQLSWFIGPTEWASDPDLYRRLLDGDSDARRIFDSIRARANG